MTFYLHTFASLFVVGFLCLPQPGRSQVPMTGAGVGAPGGTPPPAYTGPGDVVSGALVWYSAARAYSSADRGNKLINVCNVADVACADMSSDATTGAINIIAVGGVTCGATAGVNLCTIKTFYDRSGNGVDITRTTIAQRATLTLNCIGSIPCAVCAANCVYPSVASVAQNQPYSSAWVANRTGANTSYGVIINSAAGTETGFGAATNRVFIYGAPELDLGGATDGSFHAAQVVFNGASSSINVDSLTQVTGTTSSAALSGLVNILNASGGSLQFTGQFMETGYWPVGFSGTNITNINSNAHTYYGF